MPEATPLEERGIQKIGDRQYAIEGDGFRSAEDEQSVWHVDLGAHPCPTCDCPAFFSSLADPPVCKHITYLAHVDLVLQAKRYDEIFGPAYPNG